MSATAEQDLLVTVSDLDCMPDDGHRYEVVDGMLYVQGETDMSAAPNIVHQRICGKIFSRFDRYLEGNPIGEIIITPGVIFDELNGVIPDLVYISNERRDEIVTDRLYGAPELVIEILSPGTENTRRDRVVKRQLYARFNVQEYWIADARTRGLEIYRLNNNILQLIATCVGADEITSPLLPNFSCRAEELF